MKECNRCKCSLNGLAWLCTRKACPNYIRLTTPNDASFICTPNKTFKVECNTCTCNAEGNTADCTKFDCDKINESKSYRLLGRATTTSTQPPPQQPARGVCVPGTRFKQDCNTCYCTSTGMALCTLRGCLTVTPNIPVINQEGILPREKRQLPERVYTLNDLNDPNFTCTPSHSFKLECNTCWCSANGRTPRYCTRIACNPKTYQLNLPARES